MCLYPRLIKNRKYTRNKKNGGVIPPINDQRTRYVPVGCQKCIECRKQKAREWQIRLLEDIKTNTNGIFITLTFSNEQYTNLDKEIDKIVKGYERDNRIAALAIERFLGRWRKQHKKSVRHWLITELGHNGTENIHIHGIIWTDKGAEQIRKHWGYGYVWAGNETQKGKIENYVNERTVSYVTKYVTKMDEKHKEYKPKIFTTAGIGGAYTKTIDAKKNAYNGENTNETYRTTTGHKMSMPIYWRNKTYSEEEREKLWIQKLDKQERWIRGERVDISQGETEYYKLLKYHQKINKELGYGDNKKDWNRIQYEKERRELQQQERKNGAWKKEKVPPAG